MRFCPVCSYYLFLQGAVSEDPATPHNLQLLCRHCGYSETMKPKTATEALILETSFATSTTQKQTHTAFNEYTKLDPTLPHLKTIPCPNPSCPSQADPESRDILYIKTDGKGLKYQYCCKVCNTQWGS